MLTRVLTAVVAGGLTGLLLAGCAEDPASRRPTPLATVPPEPAPAYDPTAEPAEAALTFVPQGADVVTVTDWDQVRVQLGQPDLTSEGLVSDRRDFWERVGTESAALTDGLLRAEDSRLWLDYGFTQDDVDWEARWSGPDGPGWVIALRPDLPLDGVRRAVDDGVGTLGDGELRAEDHLVVSGTAEADVWANEPLWIPLVAEPATSTYLRRDCVPLAEALGPDADAEDQDRLLARHPVTDLDPLPGVVVAFGDHDATVRVEPEREDLFERLRIGEDWPLEGFPQAFVEGAADPRSGRIGYSVPRPPAAAALALLGELPFAVCPGVVPFPEPTGR